MERQPMFMDERLNTVKMPIDSKWELQRQWEGKAVLKNASMSEVTPQASGQGAAQALGKVSTEKDTGAHVQGFDRKYNPKAPHCGERLWWLQDTGNQTLHGLLPGPKDILLFQPG